MHVLDNNKKPATHFVEIFKKDGLLTHDEDILPLKFYTPFGETEDLVPWITPIAVLKIRKK